MKLEWNFQSPPPRDRWILVDLDDGSNDCVEDGEYKPAIHLAMWGPKKFEGLGVYEWVVLRRGEFDHWSDGRIMGWADIPDTMAAA